MSNDGFKWDLAKHDEKIPEKPEVFEIPCPNCGQSGFMAHMVKVVCQHVKSTGKVMVGPQPSGNLLCCKCSEMFTMETIGNAARERLHRKAPPNFEKTS